MLVLHETLVLPVLIYSCETILWKEKERSRIMAVQMDSQRMDRVLSIQIKELHGVKKGVDERIDKVLLWWFGHVERMENDRIAKRVYVGECVRWRMLGV